MHVLSPVFFDVTRIVDHDSQEQEEQKNLVV
jgi:hypothetical protein